MVNRESGMGLSLMLALACASTVVISAPALAQNGPAENATASTLSEIEERLREQEQLIESLQEQVRKLEAAQTAAGMSGGETSDSSTTSVTGKGLGEVREKTEILSADELVSADFPASWPMFGTDMRMKIGGYLKTDFVFDLDGTLDKNQFLMSTIPVEGTPEYDNDGYFAAFAKESRINFDIRRIKTGAPPLRAFVEGDFFTEGNQFRLRHAYITVGNFLAGQTWTTLSFLESLPFMIDFAAGDALFGGRSTQIRYTRPVNENWKISIALEGLDLLGIENPNGLPGMANTQLPLAAIRADYRWDTGVIFLGSSIAQLRWDGGTSGPSDEALQFDFVFAGRQALNDANYVTWNVSYGVGSGENIIAFSGSGANAVLEADGTLQTMPAFSALLGYGHEWNSDWSSNISLAYGWLDTPASRDPLSLKRGGIGHVNLIWKPAPAFSTGVEYMWGAQRVQNDALGRAGRIQFMAKFDF